MPILIKEDVETDSDSDDDDDEDENEDEEDEDEPSSTIPRSRSDSKLFSPTLQKMLLEPNAAMDFNHNNGDNIPSQGGTGRKRKHSESGGGGGDTDSARQWRIPKLTIRLRRESSSENSCGGTDSPSSRGSGSVVYEILNKDSGGSAWSSPSQKLPQKSHKRQNANSFTDEFPDIEEDGSEGTRKSFPMSPESTKKQVRRMRLKFGEDSMDIIIPPCSKAAP